MSRRTLELSQETSLLHQSRHLAVAILRSLRWFLAMWCGCTAGMILWATSAGVPGLAEPLIWVLIHALGGLMLGFMIHELAHLIALRVLAPNVGIVSLEITPLRVSLHPHGYMTGWQVAAVAAAGPGACTVVGAILWALPVNYGLHWWYLTHVIFLLPIFGDGHALVRGLLLGAKASHIGKS